MCCGSRPVEERARPSSASSRSASSSTACAARSSAPARSIRFPLRMLSVQQLDRVLRLVTACERVRQERHADLGTPFELGYFVGRNNTPNTLTRATDDKWGDIERMATWSRGRTEEERRDHDVPLLQFVRASSSWPTKQGFGSITSATAATRIPVVISDDEVYRTLPAVVVGTVDKLATIAFQPHFSHFTHGPAFECPNHGYVTFAAGPAGQRRCIARSFCDLEPDRLESRRALRPGPGAGHPRRAPPPR